MDPTMGMFDSLKYDHENDKDGTQMKANVIGRYIGLASTLVIIGMGALAVMPQENSSDEETVGGRRFERVGASLDSTISNCGFGWDCGVSLLPFRRAPPPPPEESSKSIDMMCALMALVGALLCWVICNVEMYHYTLPLEKLNDEDAAGEEEAPEDEEPESSDEEEDDGKKKKKKGKCRHRIRKCCYNCCLSKPGMKQIYENFCYRGGCCHYRGFPVRLCKVARRARARA